MLLKILRQHLDLEENDTSKDKELQEKSPREVMRRLIIWEFGYDWLDWFESRLKDCGLKIVEI